MAVHLANPRGGKVVYRGHEIGFCSPKCKARFEANPEQYLGGRKPAPQAAPAGTRWICPMDPEVESTEPGACPKCGMAREPATPSLDDEANPELQDMQRRFRISLAFTAPVFLLGMSDLIPGQPVQHAVSAQLLAWVEFALATPVVLWGGWPFL